MASPAPSTTPPRGRLFVLSAPSGAGKTTVSAHLRANGVVRLSVSYTTRTPRPGEVNGDSYFFVSEKEFCKMLEAGDFLEWAKVYGNFYGTSRAWVNNHLALGQDVLLEIDCQGAEHIRELKLAFPTVTIFLCPPDMETLRQRLVARADTPPDVLERRLAAAEGELSQQEHFDHVVVNDKLDRAVEELTALIVAQRPAAPSS